MSLADLLVGYDGTANMVHECLEVFKRKNVVVFGAGVGGEELYRLLVDNDLDCNLAAWSDNNSLKWNLPYMDEAKIVIEPHTITERYGKEVCIVVASSAYDKIKKQLLGYGIGEENIYLFNFAFMDLKYTDYCFIMDHIDEFDRAYKKMSDSKSKAIFVNILNYRISKDNIYLYDLQKYVDDEKKQYFDEELFDFIASERLLDIGAYVGDTLLAFDENYNSRWEYYYGIEADSFIYEKLKENMSKLESVKYSVYNIAAWDKKTVLCFDSRPGSSTVKNVTEEVGEEIEADKLDNRIKDKVTLIKMDIEGAEYNAIMGAKELIRRNIPILAVCVYHKRDDFFRITDLIESILPGQYHYFLRQYRYTPTETVCYAVPGYRTKHNENY